tara:strand:+ start:16312 stop:16548 length:237 start_codon:yes stop_codon:yes gene_type:complete
MSEVKTYELEIHYIQIKKVLVKSDSPERAIQMIKSGNHDGTEWRDVDSREKIVGGSVIEKVKIESDVFDKENDSDNLF